MLAPASDLDIALRIAHDPAGTQLWLTGEEDERRQKDEALRAKESAVQEKENALHEKEDALGREQEALREVERLRALLAKR